MGEVTLPNFDDFTDKAVSVLWILYHPICLTGASRVGNEGKKTFSKTVKIGGLGPGGVDLLGSPYYERDCEPFGVRNPQPPTSIQQPTITYLNRFFAGKTLDQLLHSSQ